MTPAPVSVSLCPSSPGAELSSVRCERYAGSLDLGHRRCIPADSVQRLAMLFLRWARSPRDESPKLVEKDRKTTSSYEKRNRKAVRLCM